jgi:hypothetical protein
MRCSALVAAAAMLSISSCDVVTSRYATLDDARKDRLFERGWLPDILPASSRDIRVSNDLDVNHSKGEFSFEPAGFSAFAARLRPIGGGTFEYSTGTNTWVSICDPGRGHCRYSMR